MKKTLLAIFVATALCGMMLAQYGAPAQPSPGTVPSAQQPPAAGAPPPGQQQTPPAAGQQPGASQAAPQQAAPRGPQPKTKEEYDAYLAFMNEPDPAKSEEAMNAFEQKFPQTELKAAMYQQLMGKYQKANNTDKTLELGRKALAVDPDAPVALITVASVLAEHSRDTDLDAQEKFAEIKKDAERAIQLIDSHAWPPQPAPAQQLDMVKSMAYVALGAMELNRKNDVAAEQALRKAIELNTLQPDAVTYLRLALALDHQRKYPEALTATNRAVELAANDPAVREKALQEQGRLKQLTGSAVPGGANPTAGAASSAPPSKPQQQPPR